MISFPVVMSKRHAAAVSANETATGKVPDARKFEVAAIASVGRQTAVIARQGCRFEILPGLVRLGDQLATQIVMLRNGRVTALGGVKVLTTGTPV
jgi:hypothetical protein